MGKIPILFDAVVFDLDGTLVATDSFWTQAADLAVTRAFAEFEPCAAGRPAPREWMSIVGLPLELGIRALFPSLTSMQRDRVQELCIEEETLALARASEAGGVASFPGVGDVLRELRAEGVQTAVASNCGAGYLERTLGKSDWKHLVENALCLDSPGIDNKSDMLFEHLLRFGTRSAVMVGDRALDREAAFANGMPHVHVDQGFADEGEAQGADERIERIAQLPALLRERGERLAELVRELSIAPGQVIAIGGQPFSGKSLFAADLTRLLESGLPGLAPMRAQVVSLEDFRKQQGAAFVGDAESEIERQFDLDGLRTRVLEPHEKGQPVLLPDGGTLAPDAVLLLEGAFVEHPRLSVAFDRTIHLLAGEEVLLRRIAGQPGEVPGESIPERLVKARSGPLAHHACFSAALCLDSRADFLVEHSNPLRPGIRAN